MPETTQPDLAASAPQTTGTKPSLRTVAELDGLNFHVPRYQRGYRWTETQVNELLDDLRAWVLCKPDPVKAANGSTKAPAYCLQPLVVMATTGKTDMFDVVDGQQRLTTLFLILESLRVIHSDMALPEFSLGYARHGHLGGAGDLGKPIPDAKKSEPASKGNDTPDLHFTRLARENIATWMKTHATETRALAGLLAAPSDGPHPCVQFIWHELPASADPIPVFERLNSGKIPLTDAELIRGLLLRRPADASCGDASLATRQRIALRWDHMERRLRDDEFWAFLGGDVAAQKNDSLRVCRITFLFDLHARRADQRSGQRFQHAHEHALFHHYEKAIGPDAETSRSLWDSIEDLFATLENWFENTAHYHLIGLLIHLHHLQRNGDVPVLILELLSESAKKKTKGDFITFLKTQLRGRVLPGYESSQSLRTHLGAIGYEDKPKVHAVLLCFNIAALDSENAGTVRISFRRFRKEKWDIEHIRASNQRPPKDDKEAVATLDVLREQVRLAGASLFDPTKLEKLAKWLALDERHACAKAPYCSLSGAALMDLHNEVVQLIEPDDLGAQNNLSNLTLLDEKTNRSYGAAPYLTKRAVIFSVLRKGRYILPCTLSAFAKAYTKTPASLLHWGVSDAHAYFDAIGLTLAGFFGLSWPEVPDEPAR